MERKVKVLEHNHVEVIVNVDEATWKGAQDKAFKKLAQNVTVPGFRKGKAPEGMIKGKIDQVKVMDEAINALLPVVYKDILDNENIKPFMQPKIDITKLSDKELEIKFEIVTAPKIELGEYKGHAIGHKEINVSAKDVDDEIETLRKQNATLVVKDGASVKGDTVVMDFVGSVDGKEFEGGKAENYELELGSGQFIPGFEDQLIGTKAGDAKDVNVTFPEQYTPELKGKKALFKCVIHEVKEKKLPALDLDFIKDIHLNGVNNIEELKARKREEILNRRKNEEKREYINKVLEVVAKGSKVDIPNEIIDDQIASRKKDLEGKMAQSGLTMEQYLQIVGQKPEEFDAKLREDSIKDITNFLILDSISIKEKLEVSDEELEFELAKLADQYKMKIDDVKKALGGNLDQFKNNIKMNRVEDFLEKNND